MAVVATAGSLSNDPAKVAPTSFSPALSSSGSAFGSLVPSARPPGAPTLKGTGASTLFVEVMGRGGTVDARLTAADKTRAKQMVKWFRAFANAEEIAVLLPQPSGTPVGPEITGQRRIIASRLQTIVVARLAKGFSEADPPLPVPQSLMLKSDKTAKRDLMASSIEERLKKVDIYPDKASFAVFRNEFYAETAPSRLDSYKKRGLEKNIAGGSGSGVAVGGGGAVGDVAAGGGGGRWFWNPWGGGGAGGAEEAQMAHGGASEDDTQPPAARRRF